MLTHTRPAPPVLVSLICFSWLIAYSWVSLIRFSAFSIWSSNWSLSIVFDWWLACSSASNFRYRSMSLSFSSRAIFISFSRRYRVEVSSSMIWSASFSWCVLWTLFVLSLVTMLVFSNWRLSIRIFWSMSFCCNRSFCRTKSELSFLNLTSCELACSRWRTWRWSWLSCVSRLILIPCDLSTSSWNLLMMASAL